MTRFSGSFQDAHARTICESSDGTASAALQRPGREDEASFRASTAHRAPNCTPPSSQGPSPLAKAAAASLLWKASESCTASERFELGTSHRHTRLSARANKSSQPCCIAALQSLRSLFIRMVKRTDRVKRASHGEHGGRFRRFGRRGRKARRWSKSGRERERASFRSGSSSSCLSVSLLAQGNANLFSRSNLICNARLRAQTILSNSLAYPKAAETTPCLSNSLSPSCTPLPALMALGIPALSDEEGCRGEEGK